MSIIRIRERSAVFFRNHETIVLFALRFIVGLILFGRINTVGFYREGFAPFAGGIAWTLGLSVLYAIAPPTVGFLVLLLGILIQLSLSVELMLIVGLLGICVIVFYCRMEPKRSFLIIALILAYYLRMPYLIVLLGGLYVGFAAIAPVALGTAIWSFLPMFASLVDDTARHADGGFAVAHVADSLQEIYYALYVQFTTDFSWIFNAFIFAMVIVLVYAISRLSISHSKEIALALGGLLCIFGVFMSAGMGDVGGGGVLLAILFTLLSVGLAIMIRFFDIALDYNSVRHVEFEDEDNFYYVKIVNKLKSGDEIPEPAPKLKRAPAPKAKPAARRASAPARAAKARPSKPSHKVPKVSMDTRHARVDMDYDADYETDYETNYKTNYRMDYDMEPRQRAPAKGRRRTPDKGRSRTEKRAPRASYSDSGAASRRRPPPDPLWDDEEY